MSEENKTTLTLNTIQTAVQIIGVCCQRGALKPEEMELVGKTYNTMKNFIKLATESKESTEESRSTPTPDENNGENQIEGNSEKVIN